MPPQTIEAFLDQGVIDPDAVTSDVSTARDQIAALADFDIDFDLVTRELQDEGVVKFAESFDDMLETVSTKMDELR